MKPGDAPMPEERPTMVRCPLHGIAYDTELEACPECARGAPGVVVEPRRPATAVMRKADLIAEVARRATLTNQTAEELITAIFERIGDALARAEKVEVRGFGSFRVRQRKPRRGRNPKTGRRMSVPGTWVPFFRPSKGLKERLKPEPGRRSTETP